LGSLLIYMFSNYSLLHRYPNLTYPSFPPLGTFPSHLTVASEFANENHRYLDTTYVSHPQSLLPF
jgi:hypothetical protein